MDNEIKQIPPRQFSFDEFKKAVDAMVAKNNSTYKGYGSVWNRWYRSRVYTPEEVDQIITCGSIVQQQILSRKFFNEDGFYRQIIMHYGTLLKNMGVLIPNPAFGISLQDNPIAKRVYGATNLVELMQLPELLTRISIAVLVDGTYYGVINNLNKTNFTVLDLPFEYCRIRYQNDQSQDIIEFNVQFFDEIVDIGARKKALRAYPKPITNYYNAWSRNKSNAKSSWMFIPSDIAVSFQLLDARPYFLPLIPVTLQYDEAVKNEAERAAEELKKIIIQKIPHLSTGALLFEPNEVQGMHDGAVGMLRESNPNTAVLTTYGEVDVIQSKTTDSVTHTELKQMAEHLYSNAGVSSHIFNATNSSSLDTSLQYDTSVMMVLGNKYSRFVSSVINQIYANSQIQFKYNILAITQYNEQDFISDSFKLAQSGYSFLLPALALGLSQRDLMNVKGLENNLLHLNDILIPLQSAYTQSSSSETGEETGRPTLTGTDKSDKTVANEESKDNTGG